MTDLVKTAPKAPAKANPSRVNVGALMDRCLGTVQDCEPVRE